jgi:hypothetical protein
MPTVTHRIKITAADRGYSTSGAIAVHCGSDPMKAAAQALLDGGADPADRLRGVFEGAQISPARLDAIVKQRRPPRCDARRPALNPVDE